jgi:hypothetical protein
MTKAVVLLLLMFAGVAQCFASDEPFTLPANWGGTGMMEIPAARVLREGRYRIGVSQVDPYRYYYFALSPLEGLEVGGRVTENLNVDISSKPGWTGYGNNKDKAIDIKYQFHPEGKWTPAVAIGIMDPHGTRVYASQYLVASKQIYPFDLTVGFGNGRFGKRPLPGNGDSFTFEMFTDNTSWRRDGQFFGGVQMALSDQFMLMLEYNPIRYDELTDPSAKAGAFPEPVPSKFNFGLRWRPWDWLETALTWQRGNQIGINASVAFDLGVPLIPIYSPLYRENPGMRLNPLDERIVRGLEESGFSDIIIRNFGDELQVEAQNNRYYYTPQAVSTMLRILEELAPPETRQIRIVITANGIPVLSLSALRSDAGLFASEKLSAKQFLFLSGGMDTDIVKGLVGKRVGHQWWDHVIRPSFSTFLNDPSGFFKYRLGVQGEVSLFPWKGGAFVTGLEWYPLNTVSSVNSPTANAVRTDLVKYMENDVVLGMLMLDQIEKFPRQIYGRVSAGLLEMQYAGIDAEVAKPFWGGRLFLGLSGSIVKKRDAEKVFAFKENDYKSRYETAFVNTRLNLPEIEGAVDLKMGQFLAGDRGTVVTFSKFFNGVVFSAWYSQTNTDLFSDIYNRGYHDKGISLTIPLRLFTGKDSKTTYQFGLSPWTRDVAQDINHFRSLFDYMGRNVEIFLNKDSALRRLAKIN